MKVLLILRSRLHKNNEANIKLDDGNTILYKDYLVLELGKSLFKLNNKVEIITLDKLKNEKNILQFLNKFDIVVKFSLRETIFDTDKKCLFKKSSADIIFLESPILFRDPLKKLKHQKYIRIMLNENFGNNNFIKKYFDSSIRFNKMNLNIKEWQKNGENILIINQLVGDSAIFPINPYDWLKECVLKIRTITNKKILIREHPLQKEVDKNNIKKIIQDKNLQISNAKTIKEDLYNIFVCITFSSGSAVDSLIEGVPTIATDKRSFAYEICENNISNLLKIINRDRTQLFYALVNIHWSLNEIKNGEVANFFLRLINRK